MREERRWQKEAKQKKKYSAAASPEVGEDESSLLVMTQREQRRLAKDGKQKHATSDHVAMSAIGAQTKRIQRRLEKGAKGNDNKFATGHSRANTIQENDNNNTNNDDNEEEVTVFPGAYMVSRVGQSAAPSKGTLTPAPWLSDWTAFQRMRRTESDETASDDASSETTQQVLLENGNFAELPKRSSWKSQVKRLEKGDYVRREKQCWAFTIINCCVAMIVAIILVGVAMRAASSDDTNLESLPTVAPSLLLGEERFESQRLVSMRNVLKLFESNATALDDSSTPQYEALAWLADIDEAVIDLEDTPRLQARYALATLYYATSGNGWLSNLNFLSAEHECDWTIAASGDVDTEFAERFDMYPKGVYCNENGQVLSINLEGNNLVGSIPRVLTALPGLCHLNLAMNSGLVASDTMQIVTEFGDRLITLDLTENRFRTTIPTLFGKLTNLERLRLGRNELTSTLPTELALLTNLALLEVDNNRLTGGLEHVVEDLTKLQFLNAFRNDLIISPDLRFPSTLRRLYLGRNQFEAASQLTRGSIGRLTNLRVLNLEKMNLQGSLPDADLAKLTALEVLEVDGNSGLTGALPWASVNAETLKMFSASSCSLNGELPQDLGSFSALERLDLSFNFLHGSLPKSIGDLSALEELYLNNNFLTGTIPTTVGGMTSLIMLSVPFNELSGELPTEMSDMVSLGRVLLHGNAFTGGNLEFVCDRGDDFGLSSITCLNNKNDITCSCCDCQA